MRIIPAMTGRRIYVALLLAGAAGAQQLPFKVEMTPVRLSNHQRLKTTITVRIDGQELAKRRGQGWLDSEIEVVDRRGERYLQRGSIALREVGAAHRRADFLYSQDLLVTPGGYTAYVSVSDTASGEGGAARHTFYVPPLKNDPLPGAWRDLPAVEFLPAFDSPDRWFQPSLTGRLHLPVDTSRPVKIDLLVNTTPTEATGVSRRMNDLNMSTLIPALKAMTQIDLFQGTLDVDLLDLTRRRTIFSQSSVHDLNWDLLRESLRASDPGVVDVKSLANREQRVEFFLAEVGRRVEQALEPEEPLHILIVLSGPMVFRDKVALHPIATPGNVNCKVFYIRYAWGLAAPALFVPVRGIPPPGAGPAGRGRGLPGDGSSEAVHISPGPNPQDDSLEATLKPLKPRLFHVESPMAFRRALAEVLAEISRN